MEINKNAIRHKKRDQRCYFSKEQSNVYTVKPTELSRKGH